MQDPNDPRTDAAWRFIALIETIVGTVDTPATKLDRVYGALVALHTELDQIGPVTELVGPDHPIHDQGRQDDPPGVSWSPPHDPGDPGRVNRNRSHWLPGPGAGINV